MSTENTVATTENAEKARTGPCSVEGCGCQAFSASPGGPDFPPGNSCTRQKRSGWHVQSHERRT